MPSLPANFGSIIHALNNASVRFVIIGGVALSIHGGDNVTFDVDISFARDPDNTEAIAKAVRVYHPRLRGIPAGLPFILDGQTIRNASALTLETDMGDLDLLAEPVGVDSFSGLYERSVIFEVEGIPVHVASLPDLAAMKRAAGRPKDLTHLMTIEALQQVQKQKKESDI